MTVYNLVNNIDVEKTTSLIKQYEAENDEQIRIQQAILAEERREIEYQLEKENRKYQLLEEEIEVDSCTVSMPIMD